MQKGVKTVSHFQTLSCLFERSLFSEIFCMEDSMNISATA